MGKHGNKKSGKMHEKKKQNKSIENDRMVWEYMDALDDLEEPEEAGIKAEAEEPYMPQNAAGEKKAKKNIEADEQQERGKKKKDLSGEERKEREEMIRESGQVVLNKDGKYCIHLISIIGEIEGHECLGSNTKTTKYEHILPQLAAIEDSPEVDGVLILLNTVGGDVEAGLAIAEMIASLSKPTVSLVLGGSHSIGVPIAVSTDYSFIVPSATMVIHPVRLNGMVIGVQQTFDYFRQIQDRILNFITMHCDAEKKRMEELMMETEVLTKDVGTILVGEEAVAEDIIDAVGGIHDAFQKLYSMIEDDKKNR